MSKDSFATDSVIFPSCFTIAKSLTLFMSLFAIRGVPLERFAIASAPFSSISMSKIFAVRVITCASSSSE